VVTTEPTDAEIEAAARVLWSRRTSEPWEARGAEFPDSVDLAHTRDDARAALTAALPLVEPRLREQIAQEVTPKSPPQKNEWCAALHFAARIARGTP
jgi:hypothetical protein